MDIMQAPSWGFIFGFLLAVRERGQLGNFTPETALNEQTALNPFSGVERDLFYGFPECHVSTWV